MKAKKRYALLLLTVFIFIYNTFFPTYLITGSYISNIEDSFASEGINNDEVLEILNDGTFKSDSWGEGTWKLEHGINGTRIHFEFEDESFNTYFYRRFFFSKPRIVIFRDLDSEFIKN